jgi:Nitrate/nitrite transporter
MTQVQPQRTTSDLVKAAVSGWLGTALEFMDFQLYSLGAALVFHEIFFPEQSAAMALILAMGTYGAGYIARIVGAFIFGRMGDSIGRKKVLFITITMMGICTTLIGVLPTYAQIGIFAPVLLVTLRIIQGLGAGAEISGAGTMIKTHIAHAVNGGFDVFDGVPRQLTIRNLRQLLVKLVIELEKVIQLFTVNRNTLLMQVLLQLITLVVIDKRCGAARDGTFNGLTDKTTITNLRK